MKTLRTLEGFLAIYGLEKIALDETNMSWVAESEEEERQLKIRSFNFRFKKPEQIPHKAPFSVITRSIIASTKNQDWEVPLNFFRKGRNDFQERRYIDAIHDFYFLLETLFGNGKTRNRQVKSEFRKSPELLNHIAQILKAGEQSIRRRGGRTNLLDVFRDKYSKKSPEEYIDYIVDLRGFLHHHTLQNRKIWHPALEYEYELDALLLQDLCFKLCSTKVESIVCVPLTPEERQKMKPKGSG